MREWYTTFFNSWKGVVSNQRHMLRFAANLVVCYGLYMGLVELLVYNRFRPGAQLNDIVQPYFMPFDFSIPIFVLTYSCVIFYIVYILPYPNEFYYAVRAFLMVFVFRAVTILLIPLAPPDGMIILHDPFLDFIVGNNVEILNDLFFSGHVADVCIFIFCCRNRYLRMYMTVCVIAVAVMLVIQRVHYTADVVVAPLFAYLSYILFAKKGIENPSL